MSNTKENIELAPCPFCGANPDAWTTYNNLAGNGEYNIACCTELSEGFILDEYNPKPSDSESYAKNVAINLWNTRSPKVAMPEDKPVFVGVDFSEDFTKEIKDKAIVEFVDEILAILEKEKDSVDVGRGEIISQIAMLKYHSEPNRQAIRKALSIEGE